LIAVITRNNLWSPSWGRSIQSNPLFLFL